MRSAGLFSGIGGLELGLEEAGFETVFLCEIADAPREVLADRFAGVPLAADVRDVDRLPPGVEVLTAGWPCQDISFAGKMLGTMRGARSSLFVHPIRIAVDNDVPWLLMENVPNLLRGGKGRWMSHLTRLLDDAGFHWAYRLVDTRGFGLPQRRERVFILASREYDPRDILLADDGAPPEKLPWAEWANYATGWYWHMGKTGVGLTVDAIPPITRSTGVGIRTAPAIREVDGDIITPAIEDLERLQGFPAGWTEAVEGWGRWGAVGNAVSVPVSAWIGERLVTPGVYDQGRDMPLRRRPWPKAAYSVGSRERAVDVGPYPTGQQHPALDDFLQYEGYPLTRGQAEGFLRRATGSGGRINYPKGFLTAIRQYIRERT
jgi:DNA (cytosine-5)-methyltransferase 1